VRDHVITQASGQKAGCAVGRRWVKRNLVAKGIGGGYLAASIKLQSFEAHRIRREGPIFCRSASFSCY